MIDLTKFAGFSLKLDNNKLIFGEEVNHTQPNIRTLEQMKPVF